MSFVRVKKRKKNNVIYKYACEVENYWDKEKNQPRQKIIGYLGKVLKLTKIAEFNFFEYFKMENIGEFVQKNNIKNILDMVIELELVKHGFQKEGDELVLEGVRYDTKQRLVRYKKRKSVLEMNEGYFCDMTLKKLFEYKLENNVKSAKEFAKLLVETGLDMDKDLFIEIFNKIQEQKKVAFEEFKEKIGY